MTVTNSESRLIFNAIATKIFWLSFKTILYISLPRCALFRDPLFSSGIIAWGIEDVLLFSASSSVACNFDDVDVCGYQDLSDTGI